MQKAIAVYRQATKERAGKPRVIVEASSVFVTEHAGEFPITITLLGDEDHEEGGLGWPSKVNLKLTPAAARVVAKQLLKFAADKA